MKKLTSEELEQLFQDSLHELEVNPRGENWNQIEEQLQHENLETNFNAKLANMEVEPEQVLKDKTLQSIRRKNNASNYLKIAAGLFVLVGLFYFSNQHTINSDNEISFIDQIPLDFSGDIIDYAVCKDPELISLDQNKTVVKPNKNKKKKRKKKKTANKSKMLLDYILEEDPDVESSVDPEILASILSTSSALPFENMTVSNQAYNVEFYPNGLKEMYPLPEIEFSIHIPLQILDEEEIAELLKN